MSDYDPPTPAPEANPFCPTGAVEHAVAEIRGARDVRDCDEASLLLARCAESMLSYRDFVLGLMERASYAEICCGLAEEVQELLGELGIRATVTVDAKDAKRMLRGDLAGGPGDYPESRRRVAGEAGDVVFYLFAILAKAGIDPLEVVARNRTKIQSRLERNAIRGTGESR